MGNSSFYTIKIAVYKNLPNLQKNISRLMPSLQKTVHIQHIGNLYKASTLATQNRSTLKRTLPFYRKVFKDAFLTTANPSTDSLSSSTLKNKDTLPKVSSKKPLSFYDKIKQRTLYLCSGKHTKKTHKFLIEVTFKKKSVTYKPIIGQVPPISALYKTTDNKLFLYQKGLLNHNVYSTLEKTYAKYYLISSWIGKKKVNTLRYYFNIRDAKRYIRSF
jgi:hypothetical protein